MHQMSPGVERAVAGARAWAARLGGDRVRLSHLALALLDEDEGRPAVLVERAGLSLAGVREGLTALSDSPVAAEPVLFAAARRWSIAHRHDPEFLTDAFLLAVLRADPAFEAAAAGFGLDAGRLEGLVLGRTEPAEGASGGPGLVAGSTRPRNQSPNPNNPSPSPCRTRPPRWTPPGCWTRTSTGPGRPPASSTTTAGSPGTTGS